MVALWCDEHNRLDQTLQVPIYRTQGEMPSSDLFNVYL